MQRALINTPDPGDEVTAERRLFNYDPIGNRIDATAGTGSATYYCANSTNQYTATSAASDCPTPSTPIDSFTYDEDGNLRLDDQYEYVWDAENRLIEIATKLSLGANTMGYDEGDQRLRFVYDYMGRRSEKTHEVHTSGNWVMQSGYPKWFIYDGWNVQLVLMPGSTYDPVTNPTDIVTERKYTWGLDLSGSFHGAGGIGGLLAAVETQGTSQTGDDVSYWYFYDANGNVGQLIDGTTPSTPVLAAHYEYDPYGNVIRSTGDYANDNPFRFSTKWLDDELAVAGQTGAIDEEGLYFYGYRYYSPRLGRWIRRDPIGEEGGINLHASFHNQPNTSIDPFGAKVIARCECAIIPESHSISFEWSRLGNDLVMFERTAEGGYTGRSIEGEIVYRMIASDHTFEIKDGSCSEWIAHVDSRLAVIRNAKSSRLGFVPRAGLWNNTYWNDFTVKNGVSAYFAVQDVWKSPEGTYGLGCTYATGMVYAKTWADLVGRSQFDANAGRVPYGSVIESWLRERNTSQDNWEDVVPGDWIKLQRGGPLKNEYKGMRGLQGENLIYFGNDSYWGTFDAQRERSRAEWIALWTKYAEGDQPPYLKTWRRYPPVGLK